MGTYNRRERTERHVEFIVPTWRSGACWVEVYKAVSAAHQELRTRGVLGEGDAADDAIRIAPGDDTIVVSYVVTEEWTSGEGRTT